MGNKNDLLTSTGLIWMEIEKVEIQLEDGGWMHIARMMKSLKQHLEAIEAEIVSKHWGDEDD